MNLNTIKPVGPDFCLVRLTAAGVSFAGSNPLRYSNGRQQFVFEADKPIKVARYEWDLALAAHTTTDGNALFELVANPVTEPDTDSSEAQTTAEENK